MYNVHDIVKISCPFPCRQTVVSYLRKSIPIVRPICTHYTYNMYIAFQVEENWCF